MLSAISHVSATPNTNQPSASARQPPPQANSQPSSTDTVTLSASAQLQQELTETSAQTAREASKGDIQAKHLQSEEAAAQKNGL